MSAEVPVAIIGIGCKFPGGSDTKELFYEFLRNKGDAMIEPPADRWIHAEWMGGKDEPGKYNCPKSGFISDIDQFDNLEFGISAKEAAHFDPAIRLTLEAAHSALHDSGIDYRGSRTGVFFGNLLTTTDELDDDRYEVNNYNGVGRCVSIRANRISFTFDLRGPSLTVDTACSASATAMHLALNSIKLGECDQALVVGANTIINPEHSLSFSKLGVLSPTGSSKSFDADADGYARAEGVAAVLIKRLDAAIEHKDSIYCVLKGSAINANGKGKSLTMPEGDMQAGTIMEAYKQAKRDPAEAFYVELHATGTKVGDPIETNAAGKVFSKGRPDDKILRVGSVKSNIGHAEGVSFLASLTKVALMLHHKEIIPNIRFNKPNPKIDFVNGKMKVQTELEKMSPGMAARDGKWIASISSYGVGGSNAHVVLETIEAAFDTSAAQLSEKSASHSNLLYLFTFGTLTESSLTRWQDSVAVAFDGVTDDTILRSLAYDLGRKARAYPARSFAIASSLSPDAKFSKPVLTNSNASPKLCLVFSGQGPQHIFMGRQLAAAFPAFLDSIKQSDKVLVEKYGQESMLERTGLFIPGEEAKLDPTGVWPVREVVLSLVFIQVALVDLVKSLGIQYDFVVGHSIGEIAMGYASGHYDRETTIGIAVARAAAMTRAEGNGAMVALGVGVQKAKTMIRKVLSEAKVTSGLWIAGINSPQAVTVAGSHNLIDALVELANDPDAKVFAAKLRVSCAFHTPLMEPQEELFKSLVKNALGKGTQTPTARVMSTTDGKWLDRELNIDYCWDNIRRPVLFGTAINKLIQDEGAEGLLFLEIAPHPVLKAYIEQCGGEPVSLIRRPNPKAPAQNTGEHYQFLEGVGSLLLAGFKRVDFAMLCASPDGKTGFVKSKLPEYPYNKSRCWAESASEQSTRLHEKSRPIAPHHFRINVDTHPDLTGHIVFDAVLFPASGYVESILENGAMVVQDIVIHKPLVLNGHGSIPAHAGCVIDGDKWQFKASTNNEFDNGDIILDSVYASGSFSRVNPAFNENEPRMFDVQSKLTRSQGSITGDEFYNAIPAAYRYQDHFRDYLKVIHEIDDEDSWGGKAYLTRLEVPEGTADIFGSGYCIHPGILDSITQCGLAMFINIESKLFDFTGVFLPVKIDALRRWDSRDSPNMDEEIKKGVWTYFTGRTWAPQGPFKSDYVIVNSEGRILFTIEGFEIARAPDAEPVAITDDSFQERLTTVWQSKSFLVPPSISSTSMLAVFEELVQHASTNGRKVIRVLDLDPTSKTATSVDEILASSAALSFPLVEYFCAAITPEDADAKTSTMKYEHSRSLSVQSWSTVDENTEGHLMSFDLVLLAVDLSSVPTEIKSVANFLVPSGVALLLVHESSGVLEASIIEDELNPASKCLGMTMKELLDDLSSVSGLNVEMKSESLLVLRVDEPTLSVPAGLFKSVIIHDFKHGDEGTLIEIAQNMPGDGELWITGNDDAAGIGALGIAACLIAESPEFTVRSVLFEDHTLSFDSKEKAVHNLRRHSLLLEQHMKIMRNGEIFVRRLVNGPTDKKDIEVPGVGLSTSADGSSVLSAYFPPKLGDTEAEIQVHALGCGKLSNSKAVITYMGSVKTVGSSVTSFSTGDKVLGIGFDLLVDIVVADQRTLISLPAELAPEEIAALSSPMIVSWLALMERAKVSKSSAVLIHDAASCVGYSAVQICQRFAGKILCTVSSSFEASRLSTELGISKDAILVIDDFSLALPLWMKRNAVDAFETIFNTEGKAPYAAGADHLSAFGSYIHNQASKEDEVIIPAAAPSMHVLQLDKLVETSPHFISPILRALLNSHASSPFKTRSCSVSLSAVSSAVDFDVDTLVVIPDKTHSVKVNPVHQLFNPRKSYILVGGSSELGVRITEWMVHHGARHILLTSRRGPKGLTKTDKLYLHYLRQQGVHVDVIAADALSREQTEAVIDKAQTLGPIGGIFLMTVVLRDAKFTNLTQQSFDDVYQSKVEALNTLLSCVDPATLDFLLLFSTIGSVFGNAGQAAYCASQLYLDRIADIIPNTVSMSFPPITDSGIFKRLVLATKGRANTAQLTKTGMTTAQICNFIGDCLIRQIAHYVPMLAIGDVPETFPTCEPLLYGHLLPTRYLVSTSLAGKDGDTIDSPATLLATLLSMNADQITENALITSFGLDSLGATRYSNQLKTHFNIQVSQIELLGTMTIGLLNEMVVKAGISTTGDKSNFGQEDGSSKYGEPLIPILNDRLAYDEPYTTDASPHQYRIWLAQLEYDNARKRTATNIDSQMSRFGATQWDTHEGYFVTIYTETPLDVDRMTEAFSEVVQRHGALRTTFAWNEELGKLQQTIYPSVDFRANLIDLSQEPDASAKAYDMTLALNHEPKFRLDRLPLLIATMFDLGNGDWAFSIVIHHIIIDEASLGVFFFDLFSLYLNGPGSLPDVEIHYSDFSDWLHRTEERRAEICEEQLRFWAVQLQDAQPLHLTLATPSDKELAPITQIEARIGVGALEEYQKVINEAQATAFAGFFAAYNILLHKYSSQTSFVIGSPVTQRNLPALSNVIGFFANMLPIKTVIDEDETYAQYLSQFKSSLISSLANDDVTYEDIVAQGKASASGRGYFKHLFSPGGMNMETISRLQSDNLMTKSVISLPNGEEQYELLMTVDPKSGHVVLRFDNYLYSEDAARQFLDAYISLIERLARGVDQKIRDISAVSDHEHERLVKQLASSSEVDATEHCLHSLVEEQAKKTPDLPAVEFDSFFLTYAQLNEKANCVAQSLIQQGLRHGDVVALCFDRGIHQILALLAVIKAGAAFVPIDPDDPTLRKEMMVADCNAKILLTTSNHSRVFEKSLASKVMIAYIDDPSYEKRLSRYRGENFTVDGLSPTSLAYIMFTSGSTGKPKGVMIEHRSISNLVRHSDVYGFRPTARVMSSLAYTFDPFVVDVFGSLANGATLVTGRKELVLGDIPKALKTLHITVLHVTPSILAVVPVDDYPDLQTVVVAGEALGKKLIEDWCGRVTFRNMYGPTEASVDCISCHVTSSTLTGVIGRPLPNNRIYILDKQLRPVPIGVEGELHIGGIQLARGYLNQPELTAQSFIPSPFLPGERLYKTGDIALYRSDGSVEYCGRADRQIKLRGQRIELGEIEDVVAKYPAVQRTAIVIRTVQDAPAIVAFVEFKPHAQTQLEEEKEALKLFISEHLPRFMYPSLIAALEQLPTSRSGKIDRNSLKQMDLKPFTPDLTQEMGVPQSDVEVELMSIFSKIFKLDSGSFGVTQDLFAIGLNSLMAVQAAGIISKTFNIHIGLNNMYLRPTIRELAGLVIDAMGQDRRAIIEAEDADNDFLIEFLPIKKKGVQPRLFIVHDITGMATPFMRLGAFMPNEMYAIGDRHFGSADGFGSVESMADHYITLIKSVQPEGPYIVCGYSYGGSVALSMASKMVQAGDEIQHLILFDPIFIPAKERQSLKSTDWTQRSIDRISENFPDIGDKWKNKLQVEIRKNLDSMFDYEPPHYDGPSTLVVPKDRSWYRTGHASDFDTGADDRNGWDFRLSHLDMKVAAGRHDTMFSPAHVKVLAGVIQEILASLPGSNNLSTNGKTNGAANGKAEKSSTS